MNDIGQRDDGVVRQRCHVEWVVRQPTQSKTKPNGRQPSLPVNVDPCQVCVHMQRSHARMQCRADPIKDRGEQKKKKKNIIFETPTQRPNGITAVHIVFGSNATVIGNNQNINTCGVQPVGGSCLRGSITIAAATITARRRFPNTRKTSEGKFSPSKDSVAPYFLFFTLREGGRDASIDRLASGQTRIIPGRAPAARIRERLPSEHR